ncbi:MULTISPECIES: HEAT repeat domain-containing protein [Alcanivorax]|uniref:HEAT repeat domain-containing protein n=1 Tax=Alcanivorax TaxID=59753 RepID=UPI0023574A84|nr:hypothetical protein [Alcanivorax jadensis]MDF1636318.1 hypothetical protein [Alcanivorax jadensis]
MKIKISIFLIVLTLSSFASACDAQKIDEIQGLSHVAVGLIDDLAKSDDPECYGLLIELVLHTDQSVRLHASYLLARNQRFPAQEIPVLIQNFDEPHGEEGLEYVSAVASYGATAEPYVTKKLANDNWLIRDRACRTLKQIKDTKNPDVCKK